jgi:clan AA aspartic protease (TIGR02281 family)
MGGTARGFVLVVVGATLGWYGHRQAVQLPNVQTDDDAPVVHSTEDRRLPWTPIGQGEVSPEEGARRDPLGALLARGAYRSAIARFEELDENGDTGARSRARERILGFAAALIDSGMSPAAGRLLRAYLEAAYRDVEARESLARAYLSQGQDLRAIHILYEARTHVYRGAADDRVLSRIRRAVADYVAKLQAREDHPALLELYEYLVAVEPDHGSYVLGLAKTQIALGQLASARQSLALVSHDPVLREQVRTLLDALAPARAAEPPLTAREAVTVPLQRVGDHFIVDARLNGRVRARLLIDTGASLTVISPHALAQAGITSRQRLRHGVLMTANGRVQAPIFALDSLAVGEWELQGLQVGGLTLEAASGVDGLLGMDFLRHFHFVIDQQRRLLRLSSSASAGP